LDLADRLLTVTEPGIVPVLVHGDLHAGNLIVTDDGPIVIDWWNAHGGCWIADFVRTRWIQSAAAGEAMRDGFGTAAVHDRDRSLEGYHSLRFQVGMVEFYAKTGQWSECRAMLVALEEEVALWETPEPVLTSPRPWHAPSTGPG